MGFRAIERVTGISHRGGPIFYALPISAEIPTMIVF